MKTYRAMGSIFLIILATLIGLVVLKSTGWDAGFLNMGRGKIITVTDSGSQIPSTIHVDLNNGDVKVIKNSSVDGWFVLVKYDERDIPPTIALAEDTLSVELNNGVVVVHVKDTKEINVEVDNGRAKIFFQNATLKINAQISVGDLELKIHHSNITVNATVGTGNLDFSGENSLVTGDMEVNIGEIHFYLSTKYGGEIRFEVETGRTEITTQDFETEKEQVGNGERGRVYREGEGIDVDLRVQTGEVEIMVIGL